MGPEAGEESYRNGGPHQQPTFVIASEAKQSRAARWALDCFVAALLAMTSPWVLERHRPAPQYRVA